MINQSQIKNLPKTIGVYIFYNNKTPLYIGKALHIQVRIKSHIQNAKKDFKERAIVVKSNRIKTFQTQSEFNALLLEAELIKKYKPQYNSIWKDDKQYVYIKIDKSLEFPSVTLVRKETKKNSLYFGPFQSKRVASSLLREIRKIIPFSTHIRFPKKVCFYYKIGLCNPCPAESLKLNEIEKEKLKKSYKRNLKQLIYILKGNTIRLENSFLRKINQLNKKLKYEEAKIYRNKLMLIRKLLTVGSIKTYTGEGIIEDKESKNLSSNLLKKYYENISHTLNRVECFDVSTLCGTNSVGSMVVFRNGYPSISDYKRFKIKQSMKRSDIDMIGEIFYRRLQHKEWEFPDLLIIDGGSPQLRKVRKILDENNIKIPLIGIAKRSDRIVIGYKPYKTILVKENDSLFSMFRHIRDESHRFAKKYHILLRSKSI